MRGRQPALALGWAGIAEEPAALIAHGGVCEGGGAAAPLSRFLYSDRSDNP
jgi:hypothetical protein